MPASIDYSKLSVAQLLAVRTTIDEAIMARSSGVAATPSVATKAGKSPKEPKEKVKRKGSPGAWSDWTKKVMIEHDAEIKAFKEAAEQKAGAHLKWISANKGKTSEEWLAFKAEWDASHPKGAKDSEASEAEAESGSDSSPQGGAVMASPVAAAKKRGPKKLADMTASERAAHDAKVAEKKAKKSAGAAALEAEAKASVAAHVAVPVAAVPAPVAAVPAPVAEEAEEAEDNDSIELKIFTLDGQKYMRPWSTSASDWATGDLWYTTKKGEKSHYLGELMEDGTINGDAEEPPIA